MCSSSGLAYKLSHWTLGVVIIVFLSTNCGCLQTGRIQGATKVAPAASCEANLASPTPPGVGLVKKLAGLVSIKGEDIMIQSSTDQQVKYQRLRAALPSRLWRWKTIAGWKWTGNSEHINVLELRAINTSIRWWVTQGKATSCRMVHLTDSLVCLHALSRGAAN